MSASMARPGRAAGNVERDTAAAAARWLPPGVFVACLAWRSPALFTDPRLWAEEGDLYYAALQNMAPLKGLFRVFNGNYQLLTNALVEVALRFPARWAGHVTTYLSLALAVACCWTLAGLLRSRGCSAWAACAACAMFALQPAGYEVFLTATNVQWVSSVLALALILSDAPPLRSRGAALRCAALLACGLTGTTSCILLPLAVVSALWHGGASRWAMAGVLGFATAVQGAVILAHHSELHRPFALSPHMALPLVFQVFYAQFLPAHLVDVLGHPVRAYDALGHVTGLQVSLIGLAGIGALALAASQRLGRSTAGLLFLGAVAVPLVNEYGAQAHADVMLSGWAGARYFFIGATCVVILAAAAAEAATPARRALGAALVALALVNGAATAAWAEWTRQYLDGPSVAAQVDVCGDGPCRVLVWPTFNHSYVALTPARAR